MRGLRLSRLAVFVCVAACTPSGAIEPTCIPPGSNCAGQQAPINPHYQELAQLAATRYGLCTASPEAARNNDGYLLGMLRARLNHPKGTRK
jgi:hypothetical protein